MPLSEEYRKLHQKENKDLQRKYRLEKRRGTK